MRASKSISNSKSESGFTLTEVLVSMTIMALIASFLFSALQWGGKALHIANDTANDTRLGVVQSRLRQTLEGSRLKFEISSNAQRSSVFVGEKDRLTFIGPPPAEVLTPGLYRNQIIMSDQEQRNLEFKTALYRTKITSSLDDPLKHAQPYILIENIESLSFSYFGLRDDAESEEWNNEWINQTKNPSLIRIDVSFPEGDKRNWPILIIKTFEAD